jgi:hypothetical protein
VVRGDNIIYIISIYGNFPGVLWQPNIAVVADCLWNTAKYLDITSNLSYVHLLWSQV